MDEWCTMVGVNGQVAHEVGHVARDDRFGREGGSESSLWLTLLVLVSTLEAAVAAMAIYPGRDTAVATLFLPGGKRGHT